MMESQNRNPSDDSTNVPEEAANRIEDSGASNKPETLESVISRKLDEQIALLGKLTEPRRKDAWEKFSTISSFLAAGVLALVGTFATLMYNSRESERSQLNKKREVLISETQAVKELIPQLSGPNKDARRTALLTLCSLNNVDLATRLAPQYAVDGGIEALEDLNKRLTVKEEPDRQKLREALALAYKNRGDAYSERTEYYLAIQDYSKAIEFNPSFAPSYEGRFYAYILSTKYAAAERDIESHYQITRDEYTKYYLYGRLETHRGNYDKGIGFFSQAMNIEVWPELLIRRAQAAHLKGDHQLAIGDLSKAIGNPNTNPNPNPEFYEKRASCKEELGDSKGANEDRMMAQQIRKNKPGASSAEPRD